MSLLSTFTNKSKLNAANAKVASARASEGNQADQLFNSAYRSYEQIVGDNSFLSDTLYHWGFALFNQAQTKADDQAERVFQDAFDKFAFALLANPESLKPAIDWGAALMALATKKQASANDALYDSAIEKFMLAEKIFRGSASYNLACIYALRNNNEACLEALETSRDSSSLPDIDDILNDADLSSVKHHEWFAAFIQSLRESETDTSAEAEELTKVELNASAETDVAEQSEQKETSNK